MGQQNSVSLLLEMFLDEEVAPATAALLEPGIQFDPYELEDNSIPVDGDSITISGTKAYVPLAETSQYILVYAKNS